VSIPRRALPVAVLSSRDGSKNSDQPEVLQVSPTLLKLFGSDNMEPDCSKAEKQQAFRTLQKVSFIFHMGYHRSKCVHQNITFT